MSNHTLPDLLELNAESIERIQSELHLSIEELHVLNGDETVLTLELHPDHTTVEHHDGVGKLVIEEVDDEIRRQILGQFDSLVEPLEVDDDADAGD